MFTTIEAAREIINKFPENLANGRVNTVEFRNRLNNLFENEEIKFIKLDIPKNEADFYGGSCDTISGVIEIYLNKHHIDKIRKLYKKNLEIFKEEVFKVLIHELKHRKQFTSNTKHKIINTTMPEGLSYYKDHYELDAYAQDVAMWLGQDDESKYTLDVYKLFKKDDPKIYKKFMKKVYKYMVELDILE